MPRNPGKKHPAGQKKSVQELKRRAQELAGGKMLTGKINECTPEQEEKFWEYVVAFEEAPTSSLFKQLEESGLSLPAPETLGDPELTGKLWELIRRLAAMRTFLECTDHLSDRQLYTVLWTDTLQEESPVIPLDENSACHLDLTGSGSEEDTRIYLKYYADEETREQWRTDFPHVAIPEHEDPPVDRDRFLPDAGY